MSTIAHTVTARKSFRCDAFDDGGKIHVVQPGEQYARHVAFPHDNDLGNAGFWVLRICESCQTRYDRPMPPRRTSRSNAGE